MKFLSDMWSQMTQSSAWSDLLQKKGQPVLDLVRSNPWTSLGVAAGTVVLWKLVRTPRNLPPGPRGYPLVGALAYADNMQEHALALKPKYGEIMSMWIMGELYILLNSERVIREAFVKRSDVFSHRKTEILSKYFIKEDEIFSQPYNETWKKNKKFAVSTLKNFGFGSPKGEAKLQEQLDYLVETLLKTKGSPTDIIPQVKLLSAAIVAKMMLGSCKNLDDPDAAKLVQLAEDFMTVAGEEYMNIYFANMMVGETLALMLCRKGVKKYKRTVDAIIDFLMVKIEAHMKDIAERDAEDVVDAYLKDRKPDASMLQGLASTILIFLPDAIDTTSVLDHWLFFNVTYYPEVQKALHEEVDRVCGPGRVPTLADKKNMHYTQAVIYETLRHSDLIIMSLPRVMKEDVQFEGYNFPKGATVLGNVHAVHFNPDIFPNPKEFNPSRFLDADGHFKTSLASSVMTFVVGPRMCLGEPFAKNHVFLTLARLMQRFNIQFDPSAPRPSTKRVQHGFFKVPESSKLTFNPR